MSIKSHTEQVLNKYIVWWPYDNEGHYWNFTAIHFSYLDLNNISNYDGLYEVVKSRPYGKTNWKQYSGMAYEATSDGLKPTFQGQLLGL